MLGAPALLLVYPAFFENAKTALHCLLSEAVFLCKNVSTMLLLRFLSLVCSASPFFICFFAIGCFGEGVGVYCCGGWFIIDGIRGTHLCWMCVREWFINRMDQVDLQG